MTAKIRVGHHTLWLFVWLFAYYPVYLSRDFKYQRTKQQEADLALQSIGTLNALITVLIVWLMMDKLDCNYIATNITAYVIAQINNFFWSKYWIFSSRTGKFRREIPLFLIAFGCAYCAQFLGLFIYGAVNYLMNKKITFQLTYDWRFSNHRWTGRSRSDQRLWDRWMGQPDDRFTQKKYVTLEGGLQLVYS